jgi:putative lipoic acid-binding regulatory protein
MSRPKKARSTRDKPPAAPATDVVKPAAPAQPDPWEDAAPPVTAAAATAGGPDALTEDPAARLAAELAALSPAERYERLIDFPTDHPFKAIGSADQAFADRLRAALDALGYADVALQPRFSRGANYAAYTLTLHVTNGASMVRIYEVLGALPGLKYLL